MHDMRPFAYIIESSRGIYVGSRYSKDCQPSDLLTCYFTSSASVKPLVKKAPEEWKIVRLQETSTPKEAVTVEREWQNEYKSHPNLLNRHIISEGFFYDTTGANNPNVTIWILQAPNGDILHQPTNMTGKQFIQSLGHSYCGVLKYLKTGLPKSGSFAGWKIISSSKTGKGQIEAAVYKQRIKKPKTQCASRPVKGSETHRIACAARAVSRNAVAAMHNDESWKKISASKRAKSPICGKLFAVTFPDGRKTYTTDLLQWADDNSFSRSTIRHLFYTGSTAKQGALRGVSITIASDSI